MTASSYCATGESKKSMLWIWSISSPESGHSNYVGVKERCARVIGGACFAAAESLARFSGLLQQWLQVGILWTTVDHLNVRLSRKFLQCRKPLTRTRK